MESLTITKEALSKNRQNLEDLLKRRFYIMQSFGIYGGKAGLYDYGPPGSAIKANVEQLWREHFIIEDDILEINCTNVTPEEVLIASGHVEKFADVMVKDAKDGTICYRADHLIEEHVTNLLEKDEKAKKLKPEQKEELQKILKDLPNYKKDDMGKVITDLKIKSPKTGNELKAPYEFNLMFEIDIGPTGDSKGYLRPETAQGMFVNFKNLLEYNGGKVPFGCAQIGLGFRNEIAPRSGLLRVREFALAEIEYFVDPKDKSFPKFRFYKDHKLTLLTKQAQASDGALQSMALADAVDNGTINNETLAYFMARTHIFLQRVGIKDEGVRFRQHREDEKAHYSSDCWDAEVLTSYGWVEMVGIADRSAYDLTRHSQFSKKELVASRPLKQAKTLNYTEMTLNKQLIGKTFKTNNKAIVEHLESLDEDCKAAAKAKFDAKEAWKITVSGTEFEIAPEMVTFESKSKNVMEEKFTPNVIEPAFGIGRIIYAAWEHNFKMRTQERTYINLPPKVAPYKCSILTVIQDEAYDPVIHEIATKLKKLGVSHKVDASGSSIGKRYARTDEVGVPFAVTIDNDTLKNADVTLREIVSCDQVRIPVSDVSNVIHALSEDQLKWSDVTQKYPKFILKTED